MKMKMMLGNVDAMMGGVLSIGDAITTRMPFSESNPPVKNSRPHPLKVSDVRYFQKLLPLNTDRNSTVSPNITTNIVQAIWYTTNGFPHLFSVFNHKGIDRFCMIEPSTLRVTQSKTHNPFI